jgi:hypothetical protein
VEAKYAVGSPNPARTGQADRHLVQQARDEEHEQHRAVLAQRLRRRAVDRHRRHLGEGQVPAPAPEFREALRQPWRAEQLGAGESGRRHAAARRSNTPKWTSRLEPMKKTSVVSTKLPLSVQQER